LEKIINGTEAREIEIPVKEVIPPLTEKDIKNWGLTELMSVYATHFNPGHGARSHNLQTASNAIHNVIVYPGQSFSFNTWVGPRIPGAGYREAPGIVKGKLVPSVGGGVCQVATTLYNSVLLANLRVVKRSHHSLIPTYVPLARDATLVDGVTDFIFQNTNHWPILITAQVKKAHLIVAILGRKEGWEKVTLKSVIVDTYDYKTREIPDPELPIGTRVREQKGRIGYKAELWRTVYWRDGKVKNTLENTSIYRPQPEEYKIGTKTD
jgi:vancomycin resistance protein YoaR